MPQAPRPQTRLRLDPAGATKDKPPGWTSPSGRYYPSEQQDWEPPDWPPQLPATDTLPDPAADESPPPDDGPGQDLPADPGWDPDLDPPPDPDRDADLDLPADPGWDPDLDLPPDPDRDPNLELPPDPFPDWDHFTSGHEVPAAEPEVPPWPALPDGPYLE